jgi:hypothetical protein
MSTDTNVFTENTAWWFRPHGTGHAFVNTTATHMPEGEVAHRAYLKRLRTKGKRDES